MCVIAVCKERRVSEKEFERMWIANSDGFGMAWRDKKKNKVKYKKGFMNLEEAKQFYFSKNYPLPHILHFRIATVGAVQPELTHPFVLGWENNSLEGLTSNGVLFQNGTSRKAISYLIQVLLAKGIKLPSGAWSDSRALAVLAYELGINFLDLIDAGKIAILTPTKISIIGDFIEKNGCLFSNLHWEFSISRYWGRTYGNNNNDDDYNIIDY